MENIYKKLSRPPENALKKIEAGRLSGKTDINPQWRIEALTEQFGLCGIGWKYKTNSREFVNGSDGQIAVFVDIDLFVKVEGEWSEAIPGSGGSMFVANEKKGLFTSDEAVKMATTDAISVAGKQLGLAADIYRGTYDTKYSKQPEVKTEPTPAGKPTIAPKTEAWDKSVKYVAEKNDLAAVEKKYIIKDKELFLQHVESFKMNLYQTLKD